METKEKSLVELLNNVMNVCNYRGYAVFKIIGGYKIGDNKFLTTQEVDTYIDNSIKNLDKSIVK